MSEQILKAIEQLGHNYEEFKKANDEHLKAVEERNGEIVTETKERLERVEAELQRAIDAKKEAEKRGAEVVDRLEILESKGIRPGSKADNEHEQAELAHKNAFVDWLRDGTKERELREAEKQAIEHKAVTIASATGGGNAMPEDLKRRIELKVTNLSPFRPAPPAGAGCRIVQASTNDVKLLVDSKGAAGGWAAEATSRAETATPVLNQVAPTMGELYAVPKASEWSLDDIFFNVEDWLVNSVSTEFAALEGAAFASGDGTNKPTGFITTSTPVTTADDASPARAFGVLQYTASGAAGAFVNDQLGSPAGNPGDKLIDLMCTLKAAHRTRAVWVMNKATMCTVMKFHDGDGNYLWRPGLALGVPNTILGYPVVEAEDMPAIAANSFSIAFGDFDSGYAIVDRVGMRVTRDEVTSKGHVLWYVRKRLGGDVLNDDAIKLMKFAAS